MCERYLCNASVIHSLKGKSMILRTPYTPGNANGIVILNVVMYKKFRSIHEHYTSYCQTVSSPEASAEHCTYNKNTILLTKIAAMQNEVALSYRTVCEIYFLTVIFAATV